MLQQQIIFIWQARAQIPARICVCGCHRKGRETLTCPLNYRTDVQRDFRDQEMSSHECCRRWDMTMLQQQHEQMISTHRSRQLCNASSLISVQTLDR